MPRSSQIHQNKPLENISVKFQSTEFIGDKLSPMVSVKHESDTYYVYEKDTLGLPETLRADGSESNKATFNLSTASYRLQEHALHDDVTDRQRSNADKAIQLDIDVTEDLTAKILRRREIDLATLAQTPANFANTTSLAAANAWSNNTIASNPIVYVQSATSAIMLNSAKAANIVVMNEQTFNACRNHISILDRIKYTSADSVAEGMLAKLFDIESVVVGKSVYNSAGEGVTPSMSRVWNDNVVVAYVEKAPGLRRVSGFYTLWQTEGGNPYTVKKWREEKLSADRIEVSSKFDNICPASDCVYLIVDTVQ
jgi:hypothetical protein